MADSWDGRVKIVIPEWARHRIEDELGKLTEDVLRPALTEAGVPDPGVYVLAIDKLPARPEVADGRP